MSENNNNNSFADFRNGAPDSNKGGSPNAEIIKTAEELARNKEKLVSLKVYSKGAKVRIRAGVTTIVILAGVLIYMVSATGQKAEIKAPEGYKVVSPTNAPPRLEKIN